VPGPPNEFQYNVKPWLGRVVVPNEWRLVCDKCEKVPTYETLLLSSYSIKKRKKEGKDSSDVGHN
jgi:hypothetical protein